MVFLVTQIMVLSLALGLHLCLTDPHERAPNDRRSLDDYGLWRQICLRVYVYSFWAHCIAEIILTTLSDLSEYFPDSQLIREANEYAFSTLLPLSSTGVPSAISFPPWRIVGGILMLWGTAFRYWSMLELGKYFTFHVSILKGHKLITTGPYSIVRHPSYIGALSMHLGSVVWCASRGSFLRESALFTPPVLIPVVTPSILILIVAVSIVVTRTPFEDELLRKEFGPKWDEWAKNVPYRLIPGIY